MSGNFAVFIYPSKDVVLQSAFQAQLGAEKPVLEIMESLNPINYESEAGEDCCAYALVVPIKETLVSGLVKAEHGLLVPGARWQFPAQNVFVFTDKAVYTEKLELPEIPACAVGDIFTDLTVCSTPIGYKLGGSARKETTFNFDRWHAAQYFKTPYFDVTEEQLRYVILARKMTKLVSDMEDMNLFINAEKLLAYVNANYTVGTTDE